MAHQIQHFIEKPRICSYLADERATLEYRLMLDVQPDELDSLLTHGWRRFGPVYFRPACQACNKCISLRIPVAGFQPSSSQERAARRCRRFRREFNRPRVDPQRLDLYHAWHQTREEARNWEPSPIDAREYFTQFAYPHPCAREMALYDGDELVAVSLFDVTPHALSAVYFFYAPRVARLSPGTANVMYCIERAQELGLDYVYLGYRVEGCASLEYKSRFTPHQQLLDRPELEISPRWTEDFSTEPSSD